MGRNGDKDKPHIVFPANAMHLSRVMALQASFQKRTFNFGFDARTSRGAMRDRTIWFIRIWDEQTPEIFGIGECAPLPGLSTEDIGSLDETIQLTAGRISHSNLTLPAFSSDPASRLVRINQLLKEYFSDEFLCRNPAVTMALETAILDLIQGGKRVIFENGFVKGQPIEINGLIWMGGLDFMLQQIEIKIRDGFRCIKIKVGGLDFEKDIDIVQYIRRKYFRENIVIRLDANGSFKDDDAQYKLKELSRYNVHSIEQPVRKGSAMLAELCRNSPIPVALDEELIGVSVREAREKLLDDFHPPFIILKPSLHGGLFGCQEWIELADARKIGWWITSALESNIGLNAISQFAADHTLSLPQGLGTGEIYTNNIPSPLKVTKGHLASNSAENWDFTEIN